MICNDSPAVALAAWRQSGAVLILASAFVFLMTYIALSTVDLGAVEARMADAARTRVDARMLLDAAVRVVVPREAERLQRALARGDAQVCDIAGFCANETRPLAVDDSGSYRVTYQVRVRGPSGGAGVRLAQAEASSHVHYLSGRYEMDIRVVREVDNATLARTAVGVHVSAAREQGG